MVRLPLVLSRPPTLPWVGLEKLLKPALATVLLAACVPLVYVWPLFSQFGILLDVYDSVLLVGRLLGLFMASLAVVARRLGRQCLLEYRLVPATRRHEGVLLLVRVVVWALVVPVAVRTPGRTKAPPLLRHVVVPSGLLALLVGLLQVRPSHEKTPKAPLVVRTVFTVPLLSVQLVLLTRGAF